MMGLLRITSCSLLLMFTLYVHAEDAIDDGSGISTTTSTSVLSRLDFPEKFVFGAGSSAYQVIHPSLSSLLLLSH